MTLRKFQRQTYKLCSQICNGADIKEIFLDVCPGGGKSTVPAILADTLLKQGIYDKLLWIAPRENLVIQGENDFINLFIKHDKIIRAAKNSDIDFSKDRHGYITTMQSVIANTVLHENELKKYRYILFIDEFHFLSMNNRFKAEIDKLINLAKLIVFASGTIERGQGDKIAYVPYLDNGEINTIDTQSTKWVIYTRKDALNEKAITPLKFKTIDASGKYIDKSSIERSFSNLGRKSDNLKCSLQTGFAYQLIDIAYKKYLSERKKYNCKMLIIAPNIDVAKDYKNYFSKQSNGVEIATSDNTSAARKHIYNFKHTNKVNILIGIGMFYIGFSCKPIGVICCLTNIRSIPWLRQMAARANRLFPCKEYGYIIAPADLKFKKFIKIINSEQQKIIATDQEESAKRKKDDELTQEKIDITPLFSKANIVIDSIGENRIIPDSELEKQLRKNITSVINSYVGRKSIKIIDGKKKIVKTESMRRRMLIWFRIMQIVNHGRDVKGKIIKKKIDEMTIKELNKVYEFVNETYA